MADGKPSTEMEQQQGLSEKAEQTYERKVEKYKDRRSVKVKLSKLSKLSNLTSVSSLYLKQKTKVEEARVKLKYAKEEAELLKEKAALEARMSILDKERQYEECTQGLNALNECIDLASSEEEEEPDENELTDTRESRVKQYVEEQNQKSRSCSSPLETQEPAYDSDHYGTRVTPLNMLNAESPPFIPRQGNMCEEFSKFMVKKDMLLKRIHEFDDRPEFFGSWKTTFVSVVKELNLSSAEEVDLLIQYLGPESKKSAMSIRSANYSDSSRARDRIWQRLNERYARPELVESSIKQKLMSFPKIASKEVKKLYELVDIVVEIDSLKKDEQYCSLFASYDSSAGVNLIVNKLPYQLQEKWTNEASRYKEQHNLAFPPFHIFSQFLEKMARVKNDPSFAYEDTRPCKLKPQTSSHSVFVKKVDVPVSNSVSETKTSAVTICPLHKTNHSLNKCNQFREKSLQERLNFLRSRGLCFKCCGQRSHLAQDCRSTVMCSVCRATNHPTALHIDKPTNSDQDCNKNYLAKTTTEEVTSACSMVCGRTGASKSCAKTVLVKVYPRECPEKAVLTYAIVDEQSNRSLARSAFFDLFAISGPEIPYSLSSCNGNTTEFGRRCSDFTIESFDSGCKMDLPMLIECDQIPNIRDEIPSPLVAKQFSHLKDIAKFIPPIQ
ncbi:uncharacterized protein LOC134255492 [Saccostrea cucullata]|uniref:uncharacterized protein LOC134255492 n=1 Tax=Saccostrea cuccullata TaxID=36930 RepID=UPI002ED409E5